MRILAWLALMVSGLALAAGVGGESALLPPSATLARSAAAPERVVLIGKIEGVINPVTAQYVGRVISEGESRDVAAVIFTIDTPGGLIGATFQITNRMLNARVPVITYVAPRGARAASAGTFITMAGNLAAMAPSTVIGAAHPVDASGGDIQGDAKLKAENYTVSEAQKIAAARGRNEQWAEDAVRKSASIRDDEALRIKVVDLAAADIPALLRAASGRSVELAGGERVTLDLADAAQEPDGPNVFESFLHTVVDPQIALLLFTLGTYGLIFELSNPSLIFPGVIGVVAIVLALFAFGTLDASGAGIALLVFALLLFVSEIWLTSHGILTAGGIIALVLGAILLFPPSSPSLPGLRLSIHPFVIAGSAAVPVLFFALVLREALQVRHAPVVSGAKALIGATGVARSDLEPGGVVRVGGEDWTAYVEGGRVAKGERIRVRRIDSVRLVVEPADGEGKET